MNLVALSIRKYVLAAAVIFIGFSFWAYFGFIEEHIIPKNFGAVIPGHIYRSGQLSAPLIKNVLTKYNIRIIVNLSSWDPNNHDKHAEEKAAKELNVKVLRFRMGGNGIGDVNDYADAVIAIHNAHKDELPVLVHCAAGAYRTGGVVAVYQSLVRKIDPYIVQDEMEKYGCQIDYRPALRFFLNSNMDDFAVRLYQAGIIDQVPEIMPQIPKD